MTESEKREKVGWSRIATARWVSSSIISGIAKDKLVTLGELTAERLAELTDGLMHESYRYA